MTVMHGVMDGTVLLALWLFSLLVQEQQEQNMLLMTKARSRDHTYGVCWLVFGCCIVEVCVGILCFLRDYTIHRRNSFIAKHAKTAAETRASNAKHMRAEPKRPPAKGPPMNARRPIKETIKAYASLLKESTNRERVNRERMNQEHMKQDRM